ncbi:uncharacterized protein LOC133782211 [Humulus lupulus]|uniref:uncharacterized protein LOC133782211 n=1 Tax=Humulus lupulus TaxID=3486 RepID=UPI002B404C2A|nr:uncharacterized protein LOC133782211 [Humulus lupulus]
MARLLSKTFQARPSSLTALSLFLSQSHRSRSTLSGRNDRLIEVDLSSQSPDGESEALMIKKLDDIVHRIIVQRATPDWLPFLPGSSFWVPPRRDPFKFSDLVDKLTDRLSDEESLSLSSDRGWPCAHLLVNRSGSELARYDDVEGLGEFEVDDEVEVLGDSEGTHRSVDKKG